MAEGSVVVDEGSFPSAPENEEASDEVSEEVDSQEVDDQETDDQEEEAELTDKGTVKDPNPKSAVHQELANAKRQIQQMEQVLTNPDLLRRYAEQNNISLTEAKKELKEEQGDQEDAIEEITPEDLKDVDSVAKVLNNIKKSSTQQIKALKEENQNLREGYDGVSRNQRNNQILTNLTSEISAVQSKYPELNPKSPDFDKDLEAEIGSLYEELDYDQQSKAFRGSVSLVKLTDRIMKAAGRAGKSASKKAQTEVHVKQRGKIVTGKGKTKKTESSNDPGTNIAQKIAKALGNS